MSKKDDSLDAMLDQVADNFTASAPSSASSPRAEVSKTPTPDEIKPWLAASANVPVEFRNKWNTMVKIDRDAKGATNFQPSHAYRSADSSPMNYNKLIHDLVKKSASQCNFDEAKTQRLLSVFHPSVETEFSKQVNESYATLVIKDWKDKVAEDPNYNAERFPNLTTAISK